MHVWSSQGCRVKPRSEFGAALAFCVSELFCQLLLQNSSPRSLSIAVQPVCSGKCNFSQKKTARRSFQDACVRLPNPLIMLKISLGLLTIIRERVPYLWFVGVIMGRFSHDQSWLCIFRFKIVPCIVGVHVKDFPKCKGTHFR